MSIHDTKSKGILGFLKAIIECLTRPYECPYPTLDSHEYCNKQEIDRIVRSFGVDHSSSN